ncbi:HEAT repeat domain-containing protein [Candidatus Ruminimicrobiellum ovillum]|uniref:HEAT repeat domain-containing protein n=1 Tax=Candidatus Ruminimicrobiellum ovillum TaxID=1947927 RepID=UPI0035595BC6
MKIQKFVVLFLMACMPIVISCKGDYFDKAVSYQNDGEYEKAIDFYNRAIDENDHVADSEKNVGDIYFLHDQFEYAFSCYERAMEAVSPEAMDTTIKLGSFGDASVRKLAARTLSNIKNKKAQNIIFKKLVEVLNSNDENKIIDALEMMLQFERDLSPIAPNLMALLDSKNIVIKQKTLLILPKVAEDACNDEECFNKIMGYLNQNNEILKTSAIECLGNMQKYAKKALPVLVGIAVNDKLNKEQALNAIGQIGVPSKENAANMYSFLKDKPNEIKIKFLDMFEDLASKDDNTAKEYVPYILMFLKYDDLNVKQKTRAVLTKVGKAAPETIPALIDLLQDNNNEIVSRAIYELGDLGKAASGAVAPLKKIVETTQDKDIKKIASDALQKIR